MALRVAYFLIALGLVGPIGATANAQLPKQCQTLLSDDAVLYIEAPDLSSAINGLIEHWYLPFYGDAIAANKLAPLEVLPAKLFQQMLGRRNHLLLSSFGTVCDRSNVSFPEVERNRLEAIEHSLAVQISSDRSIAALYEHFSNLFSGRGFFAIDKCEGMSVVVFGFEYDPSVFDWPKELEASCRAQSGILREAVDSTADFEVFYLPLEQCFIFFHNNVVFGIHSDIDDRRYLGGLMQRVKRFDSRNVSLLDSRYYQRVESRLAQDLREPYDIFVFSRVEDLLLSSFESKASQKAADRWLGWANTVGAIVRFGHNDNHFQYRVVYPTLVPQPAYVVSLFDSLDDLAANQHRALVPTSSYSTYLKFRELPNAESFSSMAVIPGDELSIALWKQLEKQKPTAGEFGASLSNTVALQLGGEAEICKFLSILSDKNDGIDFLRGSFAANYFGELVSHEDQKGILADWLRSKQFADYEIAASTSNKQRGGSEKDGERSSHPFDEKLQIDDHSKFGEMASMFSVARCAEGTLVLSAQGIRGEIDQQLLATCWRNDVFRFFDFAYDLGYDVEKYGSLRALSVRRNFVSASIDWVPLEPLFKFFRLSEKNWPYSLNYRSSEFQPEDYELHAGSEKLSWLTRLYQVVSASFRSVEFHEDVLPASNMDIMLVDSLVVDGRAQVIEYHGYLRDEKAKAESESRR